MPRVAIVTDSSADLPAELAAREGIIVVPVTASPEGDASPGRDKGHGALDPGMAVAPQPARPELVETFKDVFETALQTHDAVVAILLSSRLGGVVAAANEARRMVAPERVEVVDARSASLGLGLQALRAAELARGGASARAIAGDARAAIGRHHVVFYVESLEHLRQSGRIGRSAAMIANALQLKPLLRIDEGQIVPHERVRMRARAIAELAAFVGELPAVERCAVLYATDKRDALDLVAAIETEAGIPAREIGVFQIGETVAAHVGPGALGVAVVEADSR